MIGVPDSRGVVLAVAIGLLGCGSIPDANNRADAVRAADEACFNVRDARSYHALHDRYVYLRCARKKHFLLSIGEGCRGLSHGSGIAISNEFDRVCSQSGAVITYRQFDQTHRCLILQVEAVANLEAATALVEDRTTPAAASPK
jgi:hypothetical protein